MKQVWRVRVPAALVLGAALALALGCGGREIQSRWRDRPLTVDGSTVEWEGAVRYLPDYKVSVGAMNDGDDLYLTFSTADTRIAMQVLLRGFTVWLDPQGGNRLGIHFPLGRVGRDGKGRKGDGDAGGNGEEDRDRDRDRGGWDGPGGRLDPDEHPDLGRMVIAYRGPDAEMEILGGGEPQRTPVAKARGIQVSIDSVNEVLVYELRVPLHPGEGGSASLNLAPGGQVGVELRTAEAKFEGIPPPRTGGDWDSGSREPGAGFGGRPAGDRPGGMAPGPGSDQPGPLNAHFKLRLATAP